MKNNRFSRCKALVVTHAMVLTVALTACKPTSTPEKIEHAKQATVYTLTCEQALRLRRAGEVETMDHLTHGMLVLLPFAYDSVEEDFERVGLPKRVHVHDIIAPAVMGKINDYMDEYCSRNPIESYLYGLLRYTRGLPAKS